MNPFIFIISLSSPICLRWRCAGNYSFVFVFKTNALTIILTLSHTIFLVHYFSRAIAGNYYGRSCGHNFKPQIFIMVQYCAQIKTSFKFEIFSCGFSGAGKFMRKYFAKKFCPDIYIFKHQLPDLVFSFQTGVKYYSNYFL